MTTQPFEEPSRVHKSHNPHVVVTWEGDAGLSAVSPQLPGFSYGRPTRTEFIADYEKVLRDAGVVGGVLGHEQRRFASPEGTEYVIRVAEDEHHAERTELAWRLEAALETEQRHELLNSATNPMGEVTYICCVATDTLGWASEQMDPRGDAVQVALAVADELVWKTQFATAAEQSEGWASMEDRGWTTETAVGEVCQQLAAGERAPSWSDELVCALMPAACGVLAGRAVPRTYVTALARGFLD